MPSTVTGSGRPRGKYSSAQTTIMAARMSVPARRRKAQPASLTRVSTVRAAGHLYSGISITNTGVSPRSSVRFRSSATRGAATRPMAYMQNIVKPGTQNA